MRKVTYSMGVSLDGYIHGPDGTFDWSVPDPEMFAHFTDELRRVDVHLLGRRLYETMRYWDTSTRRSSSVKCANISGSGTDQSNEPSGPWM